MKLSAKTEYACIALLELAAVHGRKEPLQIRAIAQRHQIPPRFLVQILLQLKGAGLVQSTRGAAGGYQLARPPQKISLGDVLDVLEGPAEQRLSSSLPSDSPSARTLMQVWHEVAEAEHSVLERISLADLVERSRRQAETMYYI